MFIKPIETRKCCFCKLPCVEIMFHIEKAHSHHTYSQGIPLNQMRIVKIIYISKNAIVKNGTSKIWIDRLFAKHETIFIKLGISLYFK